MLFHIRKWDSIERQKFEHSALAGLR